MEREKVPLRASAGSATSNLSPANYNTDLGREGGAVLSLITVWVDVTGYKSHTVSDDHREEE